MRRIRGLKELRGSYDSLICDIWGVLHNGVRASPETIRALRCFRAETGPVLLVSNAPRPAGSIAAQLRTLQVPDDCYDAILTSGDVTRAALGARPGARLLHLGAARDLPLYEGLDVHLVPASEAELVSCTGLFDDDVESPEDYRGMLQELAARGLDMVCANPDLVVERGDRLVYCAGALARLYEELGGRAILLGKPHAPIYKEARAILTALGGTNSLAVGDGLPTDIRGAVDNGFDVLFVTGGIHAADFGPPSEPDGERVAARLDAEGLRAVAYLPGLVWDGPHRTA